MSAEPVVVVHDGKPLLAEAVGARIVAVVTEAVAARGVAHLVLTGGSMGSLVLAAVRTSPAAAAIDWSAVHLWWGDERWLPDGDPERNETQNREALLDHVAVPPENVHAMGADDGDRTPEEAAAAYSAEVRSAPHGTAVDFLGFDVVMLGVGPDGHVASLFPGHPGVDVTDAIAFAVHDSPKPPPTRISLSFECLNRTREVWFLVAGADKVEAVQRGVAGDDVHRTPAAGVRGHERTLWLVDRDAAAGL